MISQQEKVVTFKTNKGMGNITSKMEEKPNISQFLNKPKYYAEKQQKIVSIMLHFRFFSSSKERWPVKEKWINHV